MDGQDPEHPEVLENRNPEIVTDTFSTVTVFLQQYGWFLILGCLVLLYIKSKLQPTFNKMKQSAEDGRNKKIDPDVVQQRLEAMEMSRMRLQAEHEAKAEKFKEQQMIKEEEKRKAKIEEWENFQQGKGYRSKVKPREEHTEPPKGVKPKPKLRDDGYNPLMGGGGGGNSYRPPRRGGASGGG